MIRTRYRYKSSASNTASPSGDGSLSDVVASTVFDLDATQAASYGGTGTTWANLVTAPADGSAQTAYDVLQGDGSTSTKYPTFTGSAGDAGAYWLFDGGDWFQLKSGANTAFLRDLHKTTGGSDFWFAITGKWISTSSAFWLSTKDGNVPGIDLIALGSASGDMRLRQRGTAETNVNADKNLASGTDFIFIVTHSHAGNNTRIYFNSASTDMGGAHTFNTTTTDSTLFTIGSLGPSGTLPLPNTSRLYGVAAGNEYLDDTKAAAIIAALEARHNRDYTPP